MYQSNYECSIDIASPRAGRFTPALRPEHSDRSAPRTADGSFLVCFVDRQQKHQMHRAASPRNAFSGDGEGNAGLDGVHVGGVGNRNISKGGGRRIFPPKDLFLKIRIRIIFLTELLAQAGKHLFLVRILRIHQRQVLLKKV